VGEKFGLSLLREDILRMFKNRVPRIIFRLKTEEIKEMGENYIMRSLVLRITEFLNFAHRPVIEVSSFERIQQSVSHPNLKTETDPVSESLCFPVFRIPDVRKNLNIQQFRVIYTIVRTLQNL
jgi:hypothetical protein